MKHIKKAILLCVGYYRSFVSSDKYPRCVVFRRDGMADSPPCYCFAPAHDGPNNFIARRVKLRGLAMKTREKYK